MFQEWKNTSMKIHKLNLKEIVAVYIFIEPYIEKDKEFLETYAEVLADGKGKRLLDLLKIKANLEDDDKEYELINLINKSIKENNLLEFIGLMLEIRHG
jgi:hypothetical protein